MWRVTSSLAFAPFDANACTSVLRQLEIWHAHLECQTHNSTCSSPRVLLGM
jgi:hypothetical protein